MSDLAIVYSRAQNGIDAPLVRVEVHLSRGLPSLSIVGLPETTGILICLLQLGYWWHRIKFQPTD